MSTRCQIGIYEGNNDPLKKWRVLLYKHSDGYPENMKPLLVEYLKDGANSRNINDSEYRGAWLVWFLIEKYIEEMEEYYKENPKYEKNIERLGLGICERLYGDIEYFYAIYPNKLEIYDVDFMENLNFKDFELLETVKL